MGAASADVTYYILDLLPPMKFFSSLFKNNNVAPAVPISSSTPTTPPVNSGYISIDDVAKLEIKMGTIVTAEKVAGADKLLAFKVNFGTETRTIVSGVAQYYQPEAMVGKQVPVITNLAPRTMKGVESQGMIIYAIEKDESGRRTVMLNPEKPVSPGSLVQ